MRVLNRILLLLLIFQFACQPDQREAYNGPVEHVLIPYPQSIEYLEQSFELTPQTTIFSEFDASDLAQQLNEFLRQEYQLNLAITSSRENLGRSILLLHEASGGTGAESYRLEIYPEGIQISASAPVGVFYGIQSLKQILNHSGDSGKNNLKAIRIPCLSIQDRPRFSWRGLMLDCSRTFIPIDYLRRTIDRMSYYKMNVLHLHLTDDQGWRIEIDRYPELTSQGSRFAERFEEPEERQGFYSKSELLELVDYGLERGVTIVPEIEMPGHSIAALSCFPGLSCQGGPFEIFPFFHGPNVTSDILCAGNDKTFAFLENVLEEVLEVFPSKYIHVGGDEVPKSAWKACPKCQARMRQEGLENEEELQGWFIQEIGEWLRERDRKLIGWDEILEGHVGKEAAVMSWRGIEGGIEGVTSGHSVVMSPVTHLYLDFSPVQIPIEKVFSYQPIPDVLTPDQSQLILGIQGNFWSHIDRQLARVDAMIYPRLLAIAERAWSSPYAADWRSFSERLRPHTEYLTRTGTVVWEPPVAEWSGEELASSEKTISVDVTDRLRSPGRYFVYFRKKAWEDTKIQISGVALFMGDRQIATDIHHGIAGWNWEKPDYFLDVTEFVEGQRYHLRIDVKGTDKKGGGEVYFGVVR